MTCLEDNFSPLSSFVKNNKTRALILKELLRVLK